MMKTSLFKIIQQALTMALWSYPGLAVENTIQNDENLELAKKYKPELLYEQPMMHIYTYLGRQEVANLQRLSKEVRGVITTGLQALSLWKGYAQQLQLEVADDIQHNALIDQVKNYYQPQRQSLFSNVDPRFKGISITCCNFYGSIVAGYAFYREDDSLIAILGRWDQNLKTMMIEPLDGFYQGRTNNVASAINAKGTIIAGKIVYMSAGIMWKTDDSSKKLTPQLLNNLYDYDKEDIRINAISADGTIIAGAARDKSRQLKAVIWEWDECTMKMRIQVLNKLDKTIWSQASAISADGTIITGSMFGQAYCKIAVFWKHSDRTIQTLDCLHGGVKSKANAVNADGTIIAGWANDGKNSNTKTAVVWRSNIITALDLPSNATSSWVTTISDDGAIMAGQICYGSSSNEKSAAVVWNDQGQIIFQEFIIKNGYVNPSYV